MPTDAPKSPEPLIDISAALGPAMTEAGNDIFWSTRGKAVHAYANLEQALCRIFSLVSNTTPWVSATIFFRITNARARNDILGKLIRRHFSNGAFNKFWDSILEAMSTIDRQRNEIVHWGTQTKLTITSPRDGNTRAQLSSPAVILRPPRFWADFGDTHPQITTDDLTAFITKCEFYSLNINVFAAMNGSKTSPYKIPSGEEQPWRDIFGKSLVYLPQTDTQLYQTQQKSETQPLPSQGSPRSRKRRRVRNAPPS